MEDRSGLSRLQIVESRCGFKSVTESHVRDRDAPDGPGMHCIALHCIARKDAEGKGRRGRVKYS